MDIYSKVSRNVDELTDYYSSKRDGLQKMCEEEHVHLSIPPIQFCTDNAAMIATAAYFAYREGRIADLALNSKSSDPLH